MHRTSKGGSFHQEQGCSCTPSDYSKPDLAVYSLTDTKYLFGPFEIHAKPICRKIDLWKLAVHRVT